MALYMQQILLEGGFNSKIIVGVNFSRDENGKFFDDNGLEIKII